MQLASSILAPACSALIRGGSAVGRAVLVLNTRTFEVGAGTLTENTSVLAIGCKETALVPPSSFEAAAARNSVVIMKDGKIYRNTTK